MVYIYLKNIYSFRKIEMALRENINFMWLSACQVAGNNTIARLRSRKLKIIFKDILKQAVLTLADESFDTLKEVLTDGKKIRVDGRSLHFLYRVMRWRPERRRWQYAQSIADEEDRGLTPPDFKEMDKNKVEQTARKINNIHSKSLKAGSKQKAKLRYIQENFHRNLDGYEKQQEIMDDPNSYGKTDPDATFMRMKNDHVNNSQLKPG